MSPFMNFPITVASCPVWSYLQVTALTQRISGLPPAHVFTKLSHNLEFVYASPFSYFAEIAPAYPSNLSSNIASLEEIFMTILIE